MRGIRSIQIVDGSTRQRNGTEGLVSTAMGDWLAHGRQTSVEYSNIGPSKMSKNEVPRIGFAGCGKCSHTSWLHFSGVPGLPAAQNCQNTNFRCFWGAGWPPIEALTLVQERTLRRARCVYKCLWSRAGYPRLDEVTRMGPLGRMGASL